MGHYYRTAADGLGKNGDPIDNKMVVLNLAGLGFHRLSNQCFEAQTPSSA
jgi:hypothetical protein